MITLDTETVGLYGMPVLLQYARDNGPVYLYNIWNERIIDTLELVEDICDNDVCGFNLVFDWFMLSKLYTTFMLVGDKQAYPEDIVDELGILEEQARFLDICLKPKRSLDIMLIARRGPYQSLMDRDDIRIRRVPTAIAWHLARELERRIKFDNIYFAKAKDPLSPRWKIYDIKKDDGTLNPDFKDIKLKFKASGSLKNLFRHAFKVQEKILTFRDVEVNSKYYPEEVGYAPYALGTPIKATGRPLYHSYFEDKLWRGTWPDYLPIHTLHWYYNEEARKYASDDVDYTRKLREFFGNPEPGDNDSTLACSVASCRWSGYAVNLPRIKELATQAAMKMGKIPKDQRAVKRYIMQVMDDNEKLALRGSTKRVILEEIAEWLNDDGEIHPAAIRAREVLDARGAGKEAEVLNKLITAKRFHAGFSIFGALSNRMAGEGGLNPQGIKHDFFFRAAFPLADNDLDLMQELTPMIPRDDLVERLNVLCGGDFKGYEVTIALAVFDDKRLTEKVKSGIKVHGIMGQLLFPGKTYDEILASEGQELDMYDKGKKGFFLKVYFGNEHTIHNKLGIPLDIATEADRAFNRDYPDVKKFQDSVIRDFSALKQPGGIGTRVEWHEPKDSCETFLGFKRFFTLENKIAKVLFEMAQNPPESIRNKAMKVQRRDRIQTAGGAAQSALYGAAFQISAAVVRAAGNNYIQSPGAEMLKALQCELWELQPAGVHPWIVKPMNVHDEIMCPTKPGYQNETQEAANRMVQKYRKYVPLLAIDWFTDIPNWADKKGKTHAGPTKESSLQSTS